MSASSRNRCSEATEVAPRIAGSHASEPTESAQSFLRWAGGKRWLLPHLPKILGDFKITRYYEPFFGGGAVFFGSSVIESAHLSDLNAELIETYVQVRDNCSLVADYLALHVSTSEHYYAVRSSMPDAPAERAARFIYLNQTSYNGIYRVNLKGQYNVPFGGRTNIPSREVIATASRKLQGANLTVSDFETAVKGAGEGDLVFLDPPYTVAHNNNGFIKYNQQLFSFQDQARLSKAIDGLRERGVYYLLTNAAHASITALFDKGDQKLELSRGNSVGGKHAQRGSATEYVFTNLPAHG